jgi:hypothetical protein
MTQEITNSLNFLFAVCSNTKLTKAEHDTVAKSFDLIIKELQAKEDAVVNPTDVEVAEVKA